MERECSCGRRTKGMALRGAEGPVQFGPRIAAVIVYMYAGQFLSKDRTALALAELFGIPCSSGTAAGSPPARPGGSAGSWSVPTVRSPGLARPGPAPGR